MRKISERSPDTKTNLNGAIILQRFVKYWIISHKPCLMARQGNYSRNEIVVVSILKNRNSFQDSYT